MVEFNGSVFIVRPKEEMYRWAERTFENLSPERPGRHQDGQVYLIPDTLDSKSAMTWLKRNYKLLFLEQLHIWTQDQSLLPGPVTWNLFEQFIDYSFQSTVWDCTKRKRRPALKPNQRQDESEIASGK